MAVKKDRSHKSQLFQYIESNDFFPIPEKKEDFMTGDSSIKIGIDTK